MRFFTAAGLANLLLEKNNKGTLNNFLGSLKKVELIVIDEIGFVPLHKDAAELLFQVISDCYERKSLIITSNLEFSQWNTVFGDNRLTAVSYTHLDVYKRQLLADTLSNQGKALHDFDLVLTNPPFGTKKGGERATRDDFTFPTSNKQLRCV